MPLGLDRFLRVVSGGKYSSQSLFQVRAGKVQGTLQALQLLINELNQWHVAQAQDLQLEHTRANNLFQQVNNNVPLHGTMAQFRDACERLEPVKKQVRVTRTRAERIRNDVHTVRTEPLSITNNNQNVVNFNKEIAKAREELKVCPTEIDKVFRWVGVLQARHLRIQAQDNLLAQLVGGAHNLQGAQLAAHDNATEMLARLQDRINDLTTLANNHPFTEAQIYKAKAVEVSAGMTLLTDAINRLGGPNNAPQPLVQALNDLTLRHTALQQQNQPIKVKDPRDLLGPKKVSDKSKQKLVNDLNNNGLANIPLDSDKVSEEEVVKTVLNRALGTLNNVQKNQAGVADLKQRLDEMHVRALNSQQWNVITKPVRYVKVDGTVVKTTSEITPASQLGDVFDDMNGGGVCSHDGKSYRHAVNLASTELRDSNNNVIFSALRHGINCAFGIRPSKLKEMPDDELRQMIMDLLPGNMLPPGNGVPAQVNAAIAQIRGNSRANKQFTERIATAMRQRANLNRTQEIVLAALLRNPGELAKAQNGQQATITISSMSLVTPVPRPGSTEEKESPMLDDQMRAWNAINNQVIQVPIRNPNFNANNQPHPVINPQNTQASVLVKVYAFNFGVNPGAVGEWKGGKKEGALGMVSDVLGAWRNSDRHNEPAINALIGDKDQRNASPNGLAGDVGTWLEQNAVHEDYGKVETLAKDIAKIWDSGDYKRAGTEPYKMTSRLAVLTHMMGGTPAFNCKSGKDRTGQLDVECKLLATTVKEYGGIMPQVDPQVSSERWKNNRLEMALNSGSLEMQQLNTGHMGFKLKGVSALDKSYGGNKTEGVEVFRGTSEFTKA